MILPKESILWFCTIRSLRCYATRSRQVNTNATIFATLTLTFNMNLFIRWKYQLIPSTSQDLQDYLLIFDDLVEVHSDSLRTLPNLQYSMPKESILWFCTIHSLEMRHAIMITISTITINATFVNSRSDIILDKL